jgi:hypothetical protein
MTQRECDVCFRDIRDDETALVCDAGAMLCMECCESPDTHAALYRQCTTPGCAVWDHEHQASRMVRFPPGKWSANPDEPPV